MYTGKINQTDTSTFSRSSFSAKISGFTSGDIIAGDKSKLVPSDTDYREKFTFKGEVMTFKNEPIIKQGEYNG